MRKVIAICESEHYWTVLCNDGTMWNKKGHSEEWKIVREVPQDGYVEDGNLKIIEKQRKKITELEMMIADIRKLIKNET